MKHFTKAIRKLLVHRRLVASLAAGACVLAVVGSIHPSNQATIGVVTASTRIDAGTSITADQVTVTHVPVGFIPSGAVTNRDDAISKMASAPIPAGAILTSDSFAMTSSIRDGHVMIPLTVSSQLLSALHPGSLISVFLTDSSGSVSIARGVRVVTIPKAATSGVLSSGSDNVILIEIPEDVAGMIAGGATVGSPSIAIE